MPSIWYFLVSHICISSDSCLVSDTFQVSDTYQVLDASHAFMFCPIHPFVPPSPHSALSSQCAPATVGAGVAHEGHRRHVERRPSRGRCCPPGEPKAGKWAEWNSKIPCDSNALLEFENRHLYALVVLSSPFVVLLFSLVVLPFLVSSPE